MVCLAPAADYLLKKPLRLSGRTSGKRPGFTLVELLVVVALIVVLMTLLAPAFNALRGGSDMTRAAYDIAGILEQARAHAIANNTYVFVGFQELDASKNAAASPQTAGAGRVAMAMVASKDGTLGAGPYDLATGWPASYNKGANLIPVGKLQVFENLHMAETLGTVPTSGGMARPEVGTAERIGHSKYRRSVNPFSWPLGTNIGSGKYNFTKVLTIDRQGTPWNLWRDDPPQHSARYYEIDLQQTHGNVAPPAPADPNVGNHVAVLINGITGASRIYRP